MSIVEVTITSLCFKYVQPIVEQSYEEKYLKFESYPKQKKEKIHGNEFLPVVETNQFFKLNSVSNA